jgi:hypothetical protein
MHEPRIVAVLRVHAQAVGAHEDDTTHLDHVDAKMSDGTYASLFVALPGTVTVTDEELLGLTAGAARRLAEGHGTRL